MKFLISIAGCLFILLSLQACISSTETDPRKGGLFGYNPKAYEQRIEERKATLATTEADTQEAGLATRQLETSKQEKLLSHEALKTKLTALYSESGKLQKQLELIKVNNAGQEQELKRLQGEVTALRSKTIKTNNSNTSDAVKQTEIKRLQQHMDKLLEEAEALSAL